MIIRTYFCESCEQEFEVTCESSDGDPDCPTCSQVLEWRPGMFAITGTKSKAVDLTQQILEQDYGLSNFKDNTREGDVHAITAPPPGTAEREAGIRQLSEVAQATGAPALSDQQAAMASGFWGGLSPVAAQPIMPREALMAGAAQQTAMATAEGVNPMTLLHKAKPPLKMHIVARA